MWEEKIDLLKKNFSPQEFHVPFTDWFDILKKIESKFIAKEGSMYHLTNWADKIKSKHFVHAIAPKTLPNFFNELDENQTYWFVVVLGDAPVSKQHVYSCSPKAMQSLASITANDFFIIDKRLAWFTYFHPADGKIEVYKSGETDTPIDKAFLN
jgi:hypothetical protein